MEALAPSTRSRAPLARIVSASALQLIQHLSIYYDYLLVEPSVIQDPVVEAEAYSMEVSWKTPEYADLCIDGYRLSGWMEDDKLVEVEALSITTQNTTVVFDKNLLACQVYIIQIIPYTKENLDGQLRQVGVETKAAIVDYTKVLRTILRIFRIHLTISY